MRTVVILAVAIAGLALAAAPASAGAKMAGCDAITAPGSELATSVELTNELDRPARYKISAQVHGDRDNVAGKAGKVRGRKTKHMVTLGAGESLTQDLLLNVPDGAFGPLVVSVCITGPGGKEEYEAGTWSFPDGEMPDPSEPGDPWEEPEVTTLTGTVYLNEDLFPLRGDPNGDEPWNGGDDPMPPDGWLPPPFESELRFETEDGDEWQLLGPEAWVLAELMWEAGVAEAAATIEGFPVEEMPIFYAETGGLRLKRPEPVFGDVFFLVSFEVEGIEDPRDKLVYFRWFLDGPMCAYSSETEDLTVVARDQTEFDDMLDAAGIVLPDCPEVPDDPVWVRSGFGMENGWSSPGSPDDPGSYLPPDDWYWCPWEVNFDEETIIGVFSAECSTTGFYVCVDQVLKEDEDTIVVKYWTQAPSEWDWVAQVVTSPFTIIAIPKIGDDVEVRFEEVDAPTWYYDEEPVPGPMPPRE